MGKGEFFVSRDSKNQLRCKVKEILFNYQTFLMKFSINFANEWRNLSNG